MKYTFLFFIVLVLISCDEDEKPAKIYTKSSMFCTSNDYEPFIQSNTPVDFLEHSVALPASLYEVTVKVEGKTDISEDMIRILDNGELMFSNDVNEIGDDFIVITRPEQLRVNILLLVDISNNFFKNRLDFTSAMNDLVNTVFNTNPEKFQGEVFLSIKFIDGEEDLGVIHDYSKDRDKLKNSIANVTEDKIRDGSTNLNGAIVKGIKELNHKNTDSNILLLITDGKDRTGIVSDSDLTLEVGKYDGINIITMAIGDDVNSELLGNISDNYYHAFSYDDIDTETDNISGYLTIDMNSYYTISYCTPRRGGEANIEIYIDEPDVMAEIQACLKASNIEDDCSGL